MPNHLTLPFSTLHKARFDAGLEDDLPAAPEGLGDAYLATDTGVLWLCVDDDPLAWIEFSGGGGGGVYSGAKHRLTSGLTFTNTVTDWLEWTNLEWEYSGDYGTTGPLALIPSIGMYQLSLHLKIQNDASGTWSIQLWRDNAYFEEHSIYADGSGNPLEFNLTTQVRALTASPTTDSWVIVDITQDTGGDADILTGSHLIISRLGDIP